MSSAQPSPNIPPASLGDARGALVDTLRGALSELNSGLRYLSLRATEEARSSETRDAYDEARHEVATWTGRLHQRLAELEGRA